MTLNIRHWDAPRPIVCITTFAMVAMFLCAGCSGKNVTADNPVVGLVPSRVAVAEAANPGDPTVSVSAPTTDGIEQVSFQEVDGLQQPDELMSQVAAMVDGTPILVSDVLEPHAMQLVKAQKELPADRFAEAREQLIRRELPRFIEETVLMNAALVQLDADGKEKLEQRLDEFFAVKLEKIQKQTGAGTLAELEAKMQGQGTTLSNLRRAFGRQQLAGQGMLLHKTAEPTVNRTELLAEYEKRIDDYKFPAQVKWQQIWISYDKHDGKKQSLAFLDRAIEQLRNGTDFSTVARESSDGVMAKNGGHWDWTKKGSLSNPEVERLLFELAVGEIGKVIVGEKAFQIVRVTDRRPDRVTPFEEVQSDLRTEILDRKQSELTDEILKRLKKDAVITTMFDAS